MATVGSIEFAGSNTGLANMMWLILSRPDWTVAKAVEAGGVEQHPVTLRE